MVSGTNQGGVASRRSSALVSLAPAALHGRQHVLGVQHAGDRIGIATPDRVARIGSLQHLSDDLVDRRIGIERDDVAAVGHHLADLELLEVEHRAQHVVLLLAHLAHLPRQADELTQLGS